MCIYEYIYDPKLPSDPGKALENHCAKKLIPSRGA